MTVRRGGCWPCQWRWGERGAGFRAIHQAWLGHQVAQLVYAVRYRLGSSAWVCAVGA